MGKSGDFMGIHGNILGVAIHANICKYMQIYGNIMEYHGDLHGNIHGGTLAEHP